MNSHGHGSATGGAYGNGGNHNGGDERKLDYANYGVIGKHPGCLDWLVKALPAIKRNVKLREKDTIFPTTFVRENGKRFAVITAREAMVAEHYDKLPRPLDFKFCGREERRPDDLAAQVLASEHGRKLPAKYIDNRTGLAYYDCLPKMVVVKCHGRDLRFRLWEIAFVEGSQTAFSIAVESFYHEMAMPGALRTWICRDTLPSLEEVEAIIENHLADMVEDVRRNRGSKRDIVDAEARKNWWTKYIRAMAVAFLISKGKRMSMQDVPNREPKPVPAPRTEAKPDLRVEAKPATRVEAKPATRVEAKPVLVPAPQAAADEPSPAKAPAQDIVPQPMTANAPAEEPSSNEAPPTQAPAMQATGTDDFVAEDLPVNEGTPHHRESRKKAAKRTGVKKDNKK